MWVRFKKEVFILCKSYIIWIIIHYFSTILYARMCAPNNFVGFIMSPLLILSPECRALHWLQNFTRDTIANMWGALSIWVVARIKDI